MPETRRKHYGSHPRAWQDPRDKGPSPALGAVREKPPLLLRSLSPCCWGACGGFRASTGGCPQGWGLGAILGPALRPQSCWGMWSLFLKPHMKTKKDGMSLSLGLNFPDMPCFNFHLPLGLFEWIGTALVPIDEGRCHCPSCRRALVAARAAGKRGGRGYPDMKRGLR